MGGSSGGGGFFGDNWFGNALGEADKAIQDTGVGIGGSGNQVSTSFSNNYGVEGGGSGQSSGLDYSYNQPSFGNLDYLTGGGSADSLAPGSSDIPSYGGGSETGGYVDLGGSSDIGNSSLLSSGSYGGTDTGTSQPLTTFSGVQSFAAGSGSDLGQAESGGLSDAGGTTTTVSAGGAAETPAAYAPGEGIGGGEDFPDLTSSASKANAGGTASQVYDPFGNYAQGKDQDRIQPGASYGTPAQTPATTGPQSSLSSGFTAENAGNVPITDLAAGAGAGTAGTATTQTAAGSEEGGAYGTNPFSPYGTRNTTAGGEAYPGQAGVAKTGPTGTSADEKSALSWLTSSTGKVAVAGGAGLYSLYSSSNSSSATKTDISSIKSNITEINDLVKQAKSDSADLKSSASSSKDKGNDLIDKSGKLTEQGEELMSYVSSGKLPPNYQTKMDEGTKAAKAAAISAAAAKGQNVDPGPKGDYAGNTPLQQTLASIDRQALKLQADLATDLYDAGVKGVEAGTNQVKAGTALIDTGVKEEDTAASLTDTALKGIDYSNKAYTELLKYDTNKTKSVGDSITNFAKALGGGGTTIKIG